MNEKAERQSEAEFRAEARTGLRQVRWELTLEGIVALVALVISVASLTVGWWISRGPPVIAALPADEGLIYRDGTDFGAVLALALHVKLINTSSADHGDIVKSAVVSIEAPGTRQVSFPVQSLVEPHIEDDPQKVKERCAVGERCLPLAGMVIVDLGERLMSLPGGAARSDFMSFALAMPECRGGDCYKFRDFESVLKILNGKKLSLNLRLTFNRARAINIRCTPSATVDEARVERTKWLSFACAESDVWGDNP